MNDVIICVPHVNMQEVKKIHCPTCESEQEFYCWHQEWYGWNITCMNCGDCWQDGELCPRPFMRGWRKEAVRVAREQANKLKAQPGK